MKALRRLLASLNLLVVIGLLGVLFIMVNFVSSRRYTRVDLTKDQIAALSDLTVKMLHTVERPVTVVVFYQPSHPLYEFIKDLLTAYGRITPQLQIQYVDPERDIARARQLAEEFEIDALNLVIFKAGERRKYLSDAELAEYAPSEGFGAPPELERFKGEEAFTSALISVVQDEQPLVWFTTGHGEKPIDSSELDGLSDLRKSLEQQNLRVEPVTLLEQPEIPGGVRLVIVAGPTHRFAPSEQEALDAYLEAGGRLLALLDPLQDTGLEALLARWGLALGDNIVVDPSRKLPFVSAANLLVTEYGRHPAVDKLQTLLTMFPLARSVQPGEAQVEGVRLTSLATTSADGWGESQTEVETFSYDAAEDLQGPVSIAVASEREAPTPARVVAIGDSDFVINAQLANVGNRDLLIGATLWLTEQERRIGISPKPVHSIRLSLTGPELQLAFPLLLFGMPILFCILGGLMWWIRRS